MAMDLDLFLEHTDWFTAGNPQLFGDEINTRNHFGDRMLHLNPGVHLHKIEMSTAVQ